MKGIILAGGSGTRLHPITQGISKQLLPIYDKPMIYYPLSTLMLTGITEILVITTPGDRDCFERLLGDGSQWGISLRYEIQPQPEGLAQAFIIGEQFLDGDASCLVLGDNIFHGTGLIEALQSAREQVESGGAVVFGHKVHDPERYGIVEFDAKGHVVSIEEKPSAPRSDYAITGLYFFDGRVCEVARRVSPSERGELEIVEVIRHYMDNGALSVRIFGRGMAWLDTGTPDSLLQAGSFVQTIQTRQGLKVACLEEIALHMGFVDESVVRASARDAKSDYYRYLDEL